MDNHPVCHGCIKAIPIPDPLNIENACGGCASRSRCIQLHVRSYGWLYVWCSQEHYSMDRKRILDHEDSTTEDVEVLCLTYSNNLSTSHFSTNL
jgi:hypothetical protein